MSMVNGLQSLNQLRNINTEQDTPTYQHSTNEFDGPVQCWYSCVRHGTVKRVFLCEVRKDKVYYKDREDDKHMSSMSLSKFVKFYSQGNNHG